MADGESVPRGDRGQGSVIGADIVITGNIEASIDLHIEGKVNGDVRCATLILGEQSLINGTVHADRVRVSGTVEGAIETGDLAIESTARVTGEIVYSRLRVANGGVLEGKMRCNPVAEEPDAAAKLKLVEPKPAKAPPPQQPDAIFID